MIIHPSSVAVPPFYPLSSPKRIPSAEEQPVSVVEHKLSMRDNPQRLVGQTYLETGGLVIEP